MNVSEAKKQAKKDLKAAVSLDQKISRTSDKAERKSMGLQQYAYVEMVLENVQACDYPVKYTDDNINPTVLQLWMSFLTRNSIKMHVSLVANPHLTATDKLVGEVIDTYVGFSYLTFKNVHTFYVNLKLIAGVVKCPLSVVKKSLKQLSKYAHYFDNSSHIE